MSLADGGRSRIAVAGGNRHVASPKPIRILLVDDDPQAATLMQMALTGADFTYTLDVAPTAAMGLARISTDEHDVYVIDQKLPDGTGIELIRSAHAGPTTKPFSLLTGFGGEDLDVAAAGAGAVDYIEKHLVTAQLERSIRFALHTWKAVRVLQDREEQLRQAQKMEAIGRLAGGVAHDFNNLLTAIIGYTDLIHERLDPAEQTARDIGEIRKAADRAAALTRQLLSFSRKRLLNPSVVDLNDTVSALLQMLPRVIGDHIRTTANLSDNLAHVKADESQMEQVFINLVLNARDAMPMGGHLTIETANVEIGQERLAAESLGLLPGSYAMLSIGDTGTGMDAITREHAFEPFFTTKPKGKGTGLGLATVYGIIDQSGGAVYLDSALGRGTTVRIYLPVTQAVEETRAPAIAPAVAGQGTETLLLVEDNEAVRSLAAKALLRRGYEVHEARSGEDALVLVAASRLKPHLLITDITMPGVSGPTLAARLMVQNPRLRVLYLSGYPDDVNAAHGALMGPVPLLKKPFTPATLAERIRTILDSGE